jgi:DNA end-binding protein Ku
MARPIWTGTISFGLLNIPVSLQSAQRNVDLHFRMLDARDKNPIRYERVNAETGEEVPWKDVVKAYEYSKGNYVVVDEEDLKAAAPDVTETVELEAFVDAKSIDPMYFEKPYYLVPGKRAEKGYVLLRELLQKTGKVGIARVVIRTRQYLAMMFPKKDALVLDLLRFPQEIVEMEEYSFPSGKSAKYKVNPRELKMAETLLDSMIAEWNPDDYKDEFRAKLHGLLNSRIAKHKGTVRRSDEKTANAPDATTNVVDFMSLLKKSLETKKGSGKTETAKPKRSSARAPAKSRARSRTRA